MKVKSAPKKSAPAPKLAAKPASKPQAKPAAKAPAKSPAAKSPAPKAASAKAPARKPASSNGHARSEGPTKSPFLGEHPTFKAFDEGLPKGDKPIIYVNGRMVPKSQATISVYDHGLLYGDGAFEGIRIYRGKIFKCGQHMERLWRSAEAIRMQIPLSRDEMVQVMRDCIDANNISEGYIRLVVSRGYGTLGLDPRKCPVPGIAVIADQIALYPKDMYEKGMKIIVAKRPRTPIACLDPRVKSLNYLNNILAKVEAIDVGCHEAIMLNTDGYVCECTGDNIFVVREGKVFTPPSEAGILEGITRRFVIDLCIEHDIQYQLKNMLPEEVKSSDEVFLTGSAAEIIAVTQIDDIRIGHGTEGPVTRRLREAFRKVVTSDAVPED